MAALARAAINWIKRDLRGMQHPRAALAVFRERPTLLLRWALAWLSVYGAMLMLEHFAGLPVVNAPLALFVSSAVVPFHNAAAEQEDR